MGWNDHVDWIDPEDPNPGDRLLERADYIRQLQKDGMLPPPEDDPGDRDDDPEEIAHRNNLRRERERKEKDR